MKNLFKSKCQWNIVVIILAIFMLSFVSWLQFAWSMGSSLILNFSKDNTTVVEEVFTVQTEIFQGDVEVINETENECGRIFSLLNLMDSAIGTIDSKWSVYKKGFFSKIDSFVTYYGTGEILSVQVLRGSGNWLFYKSKTDGNSIADYEGTNRYTQKELKHITQVALLTQNEIESRGIRFAILVAPNKENIYSEYMPDAYVHSEYSSTDLLINYLVEKGVNIVSPKSELLDNHLESQVYYSYDTHWNQLGAYIGVKDSLATWGIVLPELSDRMISSKKLKGNYHYCGMDDLARMVGLLSVFNDEIEYEVVGTIPLDWETYEEEQNNSQISHYTNMNAENQGTILLVGDSFRSSMIPSLREEFFEVYVVHRSYYTSNMLEEINPDYLLVEYVERYSGEIESIDDLIK